MLWAGLLSLFSMSETGFFLSLYICVIWLFVDCSSFSQLFPFSVSQHHCRYLSCVAFLKPPSMFSMLGMEIEGSYLLIESFILRKPDKKQHLISHLCVLVGHTRCSSAAVYLAHYNLPKEQEECGIRMIVYPSLACIFPSLTFTTNI